jgi:hypothetical protein
MSQSVQLDMQVLQRIKFLMEYDVMKTSSENVLTEQIEASKVPALNQQRIRGTSTSTVSDYMPFGLKFSDITGNTWYSNVAKPDPSKTGTIKQGGLGIYAAAPSKEVRYMRIDDLTLKVRAIMSDWRTGTIEAIAVMLGIGIPFVIGANGIWVTLEVAQLLKGTPSWLDLVFSIIAISTAGVGPTLLKPLYNKTAQILGGKGSKLSEVVDAMYKAAVELGLLNKLKPILNAASKMANTILDTVGKTWTWLNDNVFWIFKGVTWISKVSIDALKSSLKKIFDIFDTLAEYIGKKAGLNPTLSSKLGPAARVGGTVGGTGYAISKYVNQPPPPTITKDDLKNLDTSEWDY